MYLMIRNPGVADPSAFTLLGVSTTRYAHHAQLVGMFGSGSKNAIAKFLRDNIPVTVVTGNLKMDFANKPKFINGTQFDQVIVKYSGKDVDGNSRTATDDLGWTLQWGVQDWTKLNMAFREVVANAIDGAILSGGTYKDVEITVKDSPRAKSGHTAVFLPLTPEIQACWNMIGLTFLHFKHPDLLEKKILPKLNPNDNKTYIYKKGVLVSYLDEPSTFDYNLGDELALDESRNATSWDVRYAVSNAISNANEGTLAQILKMQMEGTKVFENTLQSNYLHNSYDTKEVIEKKAKKFKAAFQIVAGENAVLTSGNAAVKSFVEKKGYKPVKIDPNWQTVLENYGIPTENKILDTLELDGKEVSDPTEEMIACTKKVWTLLEKFKLTNGKQIANVKGFTQIMDGGAQTFGYFIPGGDTIYLHTSLGVGKMMFKVVLEELVHFSTNSRDGSRDLQDFLLNFITELVF